MAAYSALPIRFASAGHPSLGSGLNGPEQALRCERDLFGQVVLVRNWGRIGSRGREMVEHHVSEALEAMDGLIHATASPRTPRA